MLLKDSNPFHTSFRPDFKKTFFFFYKIIIGLSDQPYKDYCTIYTGYNYFVPQLLLITNKITNCCYH